MDYLRAVSRAIGIISTYVVFGIVGLVLLIIFFPARKMHYRSIVFFTRLWARCSCFWFNICIRKTGEREDLPASLIVSNHVGTPDIFVIGSCFPAFFVSKAEIGRWPFLSWLAKLGATLFVDRKRKQQVRATIGEIRQRLESDCSVVLFPEAQATDGSDILPFKSSHFEAAVQTGCPVVPVIIQYQDTNRPSIACWYNKNFMTHIIDLLKNPRLDVNVDILPWFQGETDRRVLAQKCRDAIRERRQSNSE
ncbi:hypothetical protein UR09_00365 [Candidatus Nitromaritima sp. SCGC AAA799-A02]|nr:hypothetical protein UR09_00365 [Candidatus Nitromaritima sp. SCGC AAA799-A02]